MSGTRGRDYLVALLLLAGSAGALGLAQRDVGVMRDEATYFQAGERYWGWIEELLDSVGTGRSGTLFGRVAIARYFALNNEHPVLCKLLFGISWRALHGFDGKRGAGFHPNQYARPHKSLRLMTETSAFRAPGWLFAGLAAALLYLLGVRVESRLAGLTAALAYVTIPHIFFHGQLACFDSPIATMWLLTVYAYLRALERARWAILAGICFGLALATKHNAWFLPPLLCLHYLVVVWPDVTLRPFRPPRIPLVFVAMAVLGPLVFLAHWPWLWFDTWAHLKEYFGFHLHHSYYNIEYLGVNLGQPPLPASYPFVMTLFTVPTVTLVLALAGLWLYARVPIHGALAQLIRSSRSGVFDARTRIRVRPLPHDARFRYPARRSWLRPGKGLDPRLGLLAAMMLLFPLVLIALPKTPHFGGTKHWLTAYPFLALLAGVAASRLVAAVRERSRALGRVALALPLLVALPGTLSIRLAHPFGLSGYNAIAGGPAGGADLGLVRQFWGYTSRQILPHLDREAADGAQVYFHDTNYDSYGAYIRDGLLRPEIRYSGMERPAVDLSSWAMVIHELHFSKYDYWIWDAYGTAAPERVLHLDGVPVLSLYRRPGTPKRGKE
jgi:hypothetical protein